MTGGGKYEREVKELRKKIHAAGVIVAVCRGDRGHGFEIQMPAELVHLVPKVLREMANTVEADMENLMRKLNNS